MRKIKCFLAEQMSYSNSGDSGNKINAQEHEFLNIEEIKKLSEGLTTQYDIRALGTHSKEGISFSQHKYILDLLNETGILRCKSERTPIDINVKLGKGVENLLSIRNHFRDKLEG